jgi:hypothetical protein
LPLPLKRGHPSYKATFYCRKGGLIRVELLHITFNLKSLNTKKGPQNIALKILVLVWDGHKNMVNGIPTLL